MVGGGLDVPLLLLLLLPPPLVPDHMSSLLLTWGAAASAAGCRFHMVLHDEGRGRPLPQLADCVVLRIDSFDGQILWRGGDWHR